MLNVAEITVPTAGERLALPFQQRMKIEQNEENWYSCIGYKDCIGSALGSWSTYTCTSYNNFICLVPAGHNKSLIKKIYIEVLSTILFISVFGSRTNDIGMNGMSYSVSRQSGVAGSVLLIQFLGVGISNSSGTTNSTNGKYCLSVSYKWQAQLVLNYGCQLFSGFSRCLCVKKNQLMSKNHKTLDLLFVTSWKNVIKGGGDKVLSPQKHWNETFRNNMV